VDFGITFRGWYIRYLRAPAFGVLLLFALLRNHTWASISVSIRCRRSPARRTNTKPCSALPSACQPSAARALDSRRHGTAEVRGRLQALYLDNPVLHIEDRDIGRLRASGVGIVASAAHSADCRETNRDSLFSAWRSPTLYRRSWAALFICVRSAYIPRVDRLSLRR
jgi:hypothetical protein